jgi:hypothetical protein
MIGLNNNNESLRSLSQIFTPTNFSRIIRDNNSEYTQARLKRHVRTEQPTKIVKIIQYIYHQLLNNYKSEYLYKNTLINKLLLEKYDINTTTVLNEFKIGSSIADFVLLNGEARVFEIKSEFDSLDKLKKQLEDYQQFANKIYIVTNTKYIDKLFDLYGDSHIGIIELKQQNTLEEKKQALENTENFDHTVIFKTLRKKEYLDIIKDYYGQKPNVPNTLIFQECLNLAKNININVFQRMAFQKLKERKLECIDEFLSEKIPYELKHICYTLNMTEKEYKNLYKFLNQYP